MPFESAEIRWFSAEREMLWNIFTGLPDRGNGTEEDSRTDYYLRCNGVHTGIKIREGRHELKVKSAPDESLPYGRLERWIKWSTKEQTDILDVLLPAGLTDDWIAVVKKRFQKKYRIDGRERVHYTNESFVPDGCGLECTEIRLPEQNLKAYTLGLEAFGTEGDCRENLLITLKELRINSFSLESLISFGYPEFLKSLE